jgi:hypothetical protein
MIHLLGMPQSYKTILVLAQPFLAASERKSGSWLRSGYLEFLNQVQSFIPRPSGPECAWMSEPGEILKLVGIFNSDNALNDTIHCLGEVTTKCLTEVHENIAYHLGLLKSEHPELHDIFQLVMTGYFTVPCSTATGGTTSAALGILWAAPSPTWNDRDFHEFFLHELTHSLAFLDEWRYLHYLRPAAMMAEETWATSAILARKRPLDKVLHSIIVAMEILHFREATPSQDRTATALHPDSSALRRQTRVALDSVASVSGIESLLAPRAMVLLDLCSAALGFLEADEDRLPLGA